MRPRFSRTWRAVSRYCRTRLVSQAGSSGSQVHAQGVVAQALRKASHPVAPLPEVEAQLLLAGRPGLVRGSFLSRSPPAWSKVLKTNTREHERLVAEAQLGGGLGAVPESRAARARSAPSTLASWSRSSRPWALALLGRRTGFWPDRRHRGPRLLVVRGATGLSTAAVPRAPGMGEKSPDCSDALHSQVVLIPRRSASAALV